MAKKRKSARQKVLKAKSIRSSNTANFFSFVAGMVTSLTLISIAFAGFRPNDVEKPDEEIVVLGVSDFEKIIKSGTADEVARLLTSMNDWPQNETLPIRFEYQTKRIALADRLCEMDCTPEQRKHAIQSRIDASSTFYGLDIQNELNLPSAVTGLRDASLPYVDHEDPTIRRAALLGMAKLYVFEYDKNKDPELFDLACDSIFDVIDAFDDDSFVIDNTRILMRRMTRDDTKEGRQIVADFFARYGNHESEILRDFSRELNDSLLLINVDYAELVKNKWANGTRGIQELLEATIRLASNPDAGTALIKQIDSTLLWFEQIDDRENARLICNALIENGAISKNPEAAELAKRCGESGLKRLAMVGNKLEMKGNTVEGPLNASEFEGRITLVIFFGLDDRSAQVISRLSESRVELHTLGVKGLAVPMANYRGSEFENMRKRLSPWPFVLADDSQPVLNPILQQFPVMTWPYIVLLDEQGIVTHISVQLVDILTQVEKMTSARLMRESSPDQE